MSDSNLLSSLAQAHDALRFNTVKFTVRELKTMAEHLGCRTRSEKRDVLVKIITLRLANLLPKWIFHHFSFKKRFSCRHSGTIVLYQTISNHNPHVINFVAVYNQSTKDCFWLNRIYLRILRILLTGYLPWYKTFYKNLAWILHHPNLQLLDSKDTILVQAIRHILFPIFHPTNMDSICSQAIRLTRRRTWSIHKNIWCRVWVRLILVPKVFVHMHHIVLNALRVTILALWVQQCKQDDSRIEACIVHINIILDPILCIMLCNR